MVLLPLDESINIGTITLGGFQRQCDSSVGVAEIGATERLPYLELTIGDMATAADVVFW